ncbi:hypothetical protein [Thalassospira profundimaris]|nr:hypothetical protein [Thalassospira profundimaris]
MTASLSSFSVSASEDTDITGMLANLAWFQIGENRPIKLEVIDEISGGCWKSVEATKNAIKLELQRSNLAFSEEQNGTFAYVTLHGVGYETSNYSCAVYISMLVSTLSVERTTLGDMELRTGDFPTFWQQGALLSGPKSDMSKRLKDKFVEMSQALILNIYEERKRIRSDLATHETLTDMQRTVWESYFNIMFKKEDN